MDVSVFIPLHMKRWLEYMVGKDIHQNLHLTFKGDVCENNATWNLYDTMEGGWHMRSEAHTNVHMYCHPIIFFRVGVTTPSIVLGARKGDHMCNFS